MVRVVFFWAFVALWTFVVLSLAGFSWDLFIGVRDALFFESDILMGLSVMGFSFLSALIVMAPEDKP